MMGTFFESISFLPFFSRISKFENDSFYFSSIFTHPPSFLTLGRISLVLSGPAHRVGQEERTIFRKDGISAEKSCGIQVRETQDAIQQTLIWDTGGLRVQEKRFPELPGPFPPKDVLP